MKPNIKAALVGVFFSLRVFAADDVNISVTGNVVASPCLFNGGNASMNINLGDILAVNMKTAGSTSGPVPFSFTFTQCPVGTRSVTITFSGSADPSAGSDYYQNTGTARNVAVGMKELSSGLLKGPGAGITQAIQTDRTVTMAMQAWVYSRQGGVSPGTVQASAMMTMEYN